MKKYLLFILFLTFFVNIGAFPLHYFIPKKLKDFDKVESVYQTAPDSGTITNAYRFITNTMFEISFVEDFQGLVLTTVNRFSWNSEKVMMISTLDEFGSTKLYNPPETTLLTPGETEAVEKGPGIVCKMSCRKGEFFLKGEEYNDCLIFEKDIYFKDEKSSSEIFVYAKFLGLISYSITDEEDKSNFTYYLIDQRGINND